MFAALVLVGKSVTRKQLKYDCMLFRKMKTGDRQTAVDQHA